MGGNALKEFQNRRVGLDDLLYSYQDIARKMKNVKIAMIPFYSDKKDFGDLDIIVEAESMENFTDGRPDDFIDGFLSESFNCREIFKNYPVLSFEYRKDKTEEKGLQVDFIHIPSKYYDFSLNYLSYNDLGNLMGVIFKNLGFKFGMDGLSKDVYSRIYKDNKISNVEVSINFKECLNFLGLDQEKFDKGFENKKEIFEFIASSKYFSPEIYLLSKEKTNYKSRRRNAQRKTYADFLVWLQKNDVKGNFDFSTSQDKKDRLVADFFGDDFMVKTDHFFLEQDKRKKVKDFFCGENINRITGYSHIALSAVISHIKGKFKDNDEMYNYVNSVSSQQFDEDVLRFSKEVDTREMMGDPNTNACDMTPVKEERLRVKRESKYGR